MYWYTKIMVLGSRLGISTLLSGALLLPLVVGGPASAADAAEAFAGQSGVAPIVDDSPPAVAIGGSYSYQLVAAPPDHEVVETTVHSRTPLPAGLSLTHEGVLYGTVTDPLSVGEREVNIEACLSVDASQCSVTKVNLAVFQPGVADIRLPVAGKLASYSHQITLSPVGTLTSISAHGLPSGLTMTPSGLISGTVDIDDPGSLSFPVEFAFQGTFSDANGSSSFSGTRTLDLRVDLSHVVEKRIITLRGNTSGAEEFIWCPSSQPWVKQTVQTPLADKLEFVEYGWVNAFPGLNWLNQQSNIEVSNTHLEAGDGVWGVRTTVSQPWWVSLERSVELRLHCSNDPIYDPSRMEISGTPTAATQGKPYEFQLTVTGFTGANTKVNTAAVEGLPAGLKIDATGKITGVPLEHRPQGFTITTPLVSDYVSVRPGPAQFTLQSSPYSFDSWKITGAPAPATYGQPYEYQMTIEGEDNPRVVEVSGLPAGLSMDQSGKITGTATGDFAGNHTFTVRLANDYLADPRPPSQFTISMSRPSWVDGAFYHEVVFDRPITGGETLNWEARCPAGFPYLSKTAGAPGRSMGFGVKVQESGGVAVLESLNLGREYQTASNNYRYVVKNSGTMTSFNGTQHVRLEMVCTSSLFYGWSERDEP